MCSVDSRRSNVRRSAWLRSTATCLKDWIRSAARLRFATSCLAASWLPAMNSSSLERRIFPLRTSAEKLSQRRAKLDATVRLMPIGLLTSCATPATKPPSAASFSASIRLCCVSCRSRSARSARSFDACSSDLGLAFSDGVLAEHLNGTRHFSNFVARIHVARRAGVVPSHDGMHGVHQRAQWLHDAGCDCQADQDRNRQ